MDLEKPHLTKSVAFFHPARTALIGLGLISGLIYAFNFHIQPYLDRFQLITKSSLHFYVFIFLVLSLLYLTSVYLIFKYQAALRGSKGSLTLIILFAVIFRALLVPVEPAVLSKDMYRYIWDGRMQQNGINPYRHPPDARELETHRDDRVYPNINRKSHPTLYPAGAQLFFRLFHLVVGDSAHGFKGLMTIFDVLTIFVLLALLRYFGFEDTRLLIYAWNPLVIFEIAYSGHLEGLTVFWMVLAFFLTAVAKPISGVVALAISSAIKLYPALLLPALLGRGHRIRGCLAFAAAIILLYLPFLSAGRKVLGFLPIYLQNPYESFNLGLKYVMMQLFPQIHYSLWSMVFLSGLAAAGLFVFFKDKQPVQMIRYAYIMMGLLIVLMPASLHPWYVIILIPFLCFHPAVAWLVFSCMVTLSYVKYVTLTGIMPPAVRVVEYGLLLVCLAGGTIFKWFVIRKRGCDRAPGQKDVYFLVNL